MIKADVVWLADRFCLNAETRAVKLFDLIMLSVFCFCRFVRRKEASFSILVDREKKLLNGKDELEGVLKV